MRRKWLDYAGVADGFVDGDADGHVADGDQKHLADLADEDHRHFHTEPDCIGCGYLYQTSC